MHENRWRRCFAVLVCACFFTTLFAFAAFANSAPVSWDGVAAVGALTETAGCPLTVEREDLVFDLADFPQQDRKQHPGDYGGRVTATYRFLNPTDETVSATLAFPFGDTPYYFSFDAANEESLLQTAYGVTVNGAPVPTAVRYTYDSIYDFDAASALPGLRGEGPAAAGLTAETPVSLACYAVSDLPEKTDYAILARARVSQPQDGFLLLADADGICAADPRFSSVQEAYADNGGTLTFIGLNAETPEIELSFYNGYTDRPLARGRASLTGRETCTLGDFIAARRPADSPISETDWLNAALEHLNARLSDEDAFDRLDLGFSSLEYDLMRWYEYTLTLAPGETLENAVTVPMYPTADRSDIPAVWSYTYLLSPAATWADFGELAVEIRTPYKLRECSFANAEQVSGGYRLRFDSLPAGELAFSLSRTAQPLFSRDVLFYAGALAVFLTPATIGIVVAARRRKKRTGN